MRPMPPQRSWDKDSPVNGIFAGRSGQHAVQHSLSRRVRQAVRRWRKSTQTMADVIGDLGPVLLINSALIGLGYVLGRADVIPVSMGGGIGKFIGMLSLPALLFRSMASLDFSNINIKIVLGVLISKVLLFGIIGIRS